MAVHQCFRREGNSATLPMGVEEVAYPEANFLGRPPETSATTRTYGRLEYSTTSTVWPEFSPLRELLFKRLVSWFGAE